MISTIDGYGGLLWVDVVAQIDGMSERVLAFQHAARQLPKGLREWPAYLECKRTIDDFLQVLPLLQQLAHPALRPRSLPHTQLTACIPVKIMTSLPPSA